MPKGRGAGGRGEKYWAAGRFSVIHLSDKFYTFLPPAVVPGPISGFTPSRSGQRLSLLPASLLQCLPPPFCLPVWGFLEMHWS